MENDKRVRRISSSVSYASDSTPCRESSAPVSEPKCEKNRELSKHDINFNYTSSILQHRSLRVFLDLLFGG